MSKPHPFVWQIAAAFVIVAVVGCAHQSDVHQFDPLPQAEVGSRDLEPVEVRSVKELLLDAEAAFETANRAQEDGDYDTAYVNYTAMLELLSQADIQPSMFYNLRGEFERILEEASGESDIHRRREEEQRIIREAYQREPLGDLDIPSPLPQPVLDEIDEIQNLYPRNFQRGLDRSARYMPYIKNEFARAGLPTELAWLAMVESQFWPRAVSPAGASGMWQFMRATGDRFDLRQTRYLDERFNWQKSTQAAIEYLTYLYEMFDGEWALAVSAYNMGEGGMMQAIEMNNGDRNLWRLIETPPASNRIRRETKKFYPRVLATIIVASNPERYGFERNPQDPIPKRRIAVNGSYSLADLEREAGLEEGVLKDLNPDLLRDVTPPSGEYRVAVPAEEQERVELALNDLEPRHTPAPTTQLASASGGSSGGAGAGHHEVRRGETLSQIANHYGVSTQELAAANNLGNADHVRVGQQLTVPGGGVMVASGDAGHHEVRRGETLSQIAQQYSVSTQELMAVNNLQNPDQVHIGQELSIPGAGDVVMASAGGGGDARTYRVRRGDTLYEIAQREGVPVSELQQWNNMGQRDRITVGEVLQVSAPGEGERIHVVESGESPGAIANRYDVAVNDLLEWNGLGRNSVIRPGDELAIRGGSGGGSAGGSGGSGGIQELIHTVERGDTPSAIAAQYNVSLDGFLQWNDLSRQSTIGIGDELVVRVNHEDMSGELLARVEAEAEGLDNRNGERVIHVVSPGQNPTTIARRYGVALSDLFEWNDWEQGNAPVLHVGNEVVVYTE